MQPPATSCTLLRLLNLKVADRKCREYSKGLATQGRWTDSILSIVGSFSIQKNLGEEGNNDASEHLEVLVVLVTTTAVTNSHPGSRIFASSSPAHMSTRVGRNKKVRGGLTNDLLLLHFDVTPPITTDEDESVILFSVVVVVFYSFPYR